MADTAHAPRGDLALDLQQLAHRLTRSSGPQDMHPGQWAALRVVSQHRGRATVGVVADALGMTHAPASRAVAALQRKDLVTVSIDRDDHRIRRIAVTGKGSRRLDSDPIDALRVGLDAWRPGDRVQLNHLLIRLNEILNG